MRRQLDPPRPRCARRWAPSGRQLTPAPQASAPPRGQACRRRWLLPPCRLPRAMLSRSPVVCADTRPPNGRVTVIKCSNALSEHCNADVAERMLHHCEHSSQMQKVKVLLSKIDIQVYVSLTSGSSRVVEQGRDGSSLSAAGSQCAGAAAALPPAAPVPRPVGVPAPPAA